MTAVGKSRQYNMHPLHMHHRFTILGLCVCLLLHYQLHTLLSLGACMRVTVIVVCVCYHTSSYIPGLYVQSEVAYSFL